MNFDWIWIILVIFLVLSVLQNVLQMSIHKMIQIKPDSIPNDIDGIQYVGHGTVLIQMNGKKILTDPILTNRIAGFVRRFRSVGIQDEVLCKIDLVLISHKHSDHYHIPSLKKFRKDIKIFGPIGLKNRIGRYGFTNIEEMSEGNVKDFDGISIHSVPTQHNSSRNAIGYVIKKDWTVYFPGDTAISEEKMRKIGTSFSIDIALLPIGCYRGKALGVFPISFSRIHMSPHQIPEAFSYLKPKIIIPIHWGSFIIGSEPINEAMGELQGKILPRNPDIPLCILKHGKWVSNKELNRS
jgi:L-ascorbate metabolism protein UlaG (beta-lactamase superfamily)